MLRYLSPTHVAEVVKSEVRTGEHLCEIIDSLSLTPLLGFNHFSCQHEIVPISNYEGITWDDIWRFNPQASSQWDGFRHHGAEQPDGKRAWYGVTTDDEIFKMESDSIGIGNWAQDGIVARGFLIDYVSYREKKDLEANGMNGHAITLEVLEISKGYNIEFKPGDIFFLRCGFMKTWESLTMDQEQGYRADTQGQKHKHSGLVQSEAVVRYLWDNHAVAVAGDGVSFEWGVPNGEMFDLERLAELTENVGQPCKPHVHVQYGSAENLPSGCIGFRGTNHASSDRLIASGNLSANTT
ncbi:hypothetical protein BCR34DRAFT_625353 [Clohesyomyces aquaticus]|uniref:Cyclase-domain-containing protein n=1 Tax=Clohesyomyces aquaticus TaxID=1231657 RepID=A0A1Y1ZJ74_9PLEO|nr:hypothetical protein BCR34DRAFT_625353 [Clohesyomyces aquaticus]